MLPVNLGKVSKIKSSLPPAPREIKSAIDAASRLVLLSHCRPDGDALGSLAALCRSVIARGGSACIALEPGALQAPAGFLAGDLPAYDPSSNAADWDAVVVLDTADPGRVPEFVASLLDHRLVINIDHHTGNPAYGTLNWIEPDASSTGELVARLLLGPGGGKLDQAMAEALWVAVLTDTGRFCHANTSAQTLLTVASLLAAAPVRTDWLADRLYGNIPLRVMRLRQRAMAALDLWHDGKVAASMLRPSDFKQTGCTVFDVEDIVEIPRALSGTRAAFLLYATPDGAGTKVSVRSGPQLDAAAFCAFFGGGGHKRAAGCTLDLPVEEAWQVVRRQSASWLAGVSPL